MSELGEKLKALIDTAEQAKRESEQSWINLRGILAELKDCIEELGAHKPKDDSEGDDGAEEP